MIEPTNDPAGRSTVSAGSAVSAVSAGAAQCYGDVCITCSDEAVPVRVTELLPHQLAVVDTGQGLEEVSVALVAAGPGDVILVHAKEAIAVLDPSAPIGVAR
jgi:hydrogenase expression/formation protein HypC